MKHVKLFEAFVNEKNTKGKFKGWGDWHSGGWAEVLGFDLFTHDKIVNLDEFDTKFTHCRLVFDRFDTISIKLHKGIKKVDWFNFKIKGMTIDEIKEKIDNSINDLIENNTKK